ncbi:hypothetical protein B0H10DRAFT_1809889, partial [Mycena sp. CBHHK59/15]
PHTPYQYLSHEQLLDMLRACIAEKNELQLKILTLSKKLMRSSKRMADHKRLLFALATHDIPRLHHLICIAIKQRVGIKQITWRIEEATKILYKVKSFTESASLCTQKHGWPQSGLCYV